MSAVAITCVCVCVCVHVKAVVGFEPVCSTVQLLQKKNKEKCHQWGLNLCIVQCSYLRKKKKKIQHWGFEPVPA